MVTESATATDITATVTLTGGTYNVERLFNIRTTQSGTATEATDYTVFSNVVLTIPANMASGSQTFPFTAIDDMTADDGETLRIDSTLLRLSGLGADASLAVASATLTINDPVAGLTFGGATIADQTYTVGTPIPTLTLPSATGADPIFYTLNPNPTASGLRFQNMDGVLTLSGTPSTAGVTMYTLRAEDSGSARITLMFTVTVEAATAGTGPTFGGETVPAQNYIAGTAIMAVTLPVATGGTGTITYTLTGALPTGLTYNATARTITGTAGAAATARTFTYTATDTANATATLMFSITISAGDTAPTFGGASVTNQIYTQDMAIPPLTLPAATGGNGAITYTLTPAIAGLTFDAATRVLSGTPTAFATAAVLHLHGRRHGRQRRQHRRGQADHHHHSESAPGDDAPDHWRPCRHDECHYGSHRRRDRDQNDHRGEHRARHRARQSHAGGDPWSDPAQHHRHEANG